MKRLSGLFRSKKPAVDRRAPVTETVLADLEEQAGNADLGLRWVPLNRAGDLCDRAGNRAQALHYYGRAIDAMLEDGQPEPARGLATKIVRIHPEAVRTLCTLTWLDLASHHMASVVVHLNEYVASAVKGGREDVAGEQIQMMAQAVADAEFRSAAAEALDALDLTDAAAEVRARIEADEAAEGEADPMDWADLCLSHALGSNVRRVASPEEVLVAVTKTEDPQDSGASGSKKANGAEASEEVGEEEEDGGVGDVQAKKDATANSQDHTEGYPA